jgi:hypothetical protein
LTKRDPIFSFNVQPLILLRISKFSISIIPSSNRFLPTNIDFYFACYVISVWNFWDNIEILELRIVSAELHNHITNFSCGFICNSCIECDFWNVSIIAYSISTYANFTLVAVRDIRRPSKNLLEINDKCIVLRWIIELSWLADHFEKISWITLHKFISWIFFEFNHNFSLLKASYNYSILLEILCKSTSFRFELKFEIFSNLAIKI